MIINAKIIVNADDFGYSESLNKAIIKAFNKNIISTTTLMCNMPGFNEACEIVHQEKLYDYIGIHFNLSGGQPLTEPIKTFNKFFKDGRLYKSFKGHLLNKDEENAVQIELQAQLDKCIKSGIIPTHCDSHHHIHHSWGIGKVVKFIALKNNIPAIRLRFNWGRISMQRQLFSAIYNYRLKKASLAKTNYFCEIRSVTPKLLMKKTTVEVMVHPILNLSGVLTNYENGTNLIDLIKKHLPLNNFVNFKLN
jgi:predicted glycoside hydrolase/deacetylase ChbG (UPF0249 family)